MRHISLGRAHGGLYGAALGIVETCGRCRGILAVGLLRFAGHCRGSAEIVGVEARRRGKKHRALNQVAKLAYIAGPGERTQPCDGIGCNLRRLEAHGRGRFCGEV